MRDLGAEREEKRTWPCDLDQDLTWRQLQAGIKEDLNQCIQVNLEGEAKVITFFVGNYTT